jgi:hypothetical protein
MADDIYISYTDNGFLHSFSATKDAHDSWTVHFLVMHVKDRSKVYLGEYTKFRNQVKKRLETLSPLDQREITDQIDRVYVKIIQSFLLRYIARIHLRCPKTEKLFNYGQQQINKLQIIIDDFNIDLNVTRVIQQGKVEFHFTWNGDIVASYFIWQNNDTDKLVTDMK